MARFETDLVRLNHTVPQSGKEYNLRLAQRAQAIFSALLNLLPSNYISSVEGPNYTVELKAVAVELARLELAIEDVHCDRSAPDTRSDYLYSLVGYMVLLNGRIPPTTFDDQSFKQFLLDLIKVYFKGAVPSAIRDSVALFISGNVKVTENFLLIRQGGSGLDISDQFGFQVDLETEGAFPPDLFGLDAGIRGVLNIIRPAHTLYRIRYIFKDLYTSSDQGGKIQDALRSTLADYHYDDIRKFTAGIQGRDRLGVKVCQVVTGEDHSRDF